MNPNSVLLFRYMMGVPLLAIVMAARRVTFSLSKEEVGLTAILGVLMALSSLALFESYKYMNSGIASTLLFVYPIMVAVMMIFFFHEKFKLTVALCLLIMSGGLALLMKPQEGIPKFIRVLARDGFSPHIRALHRLCQRLKSGQRDSDH